MAVTEMSPGLTRESVQQISAAKNEPNWMLERRLAAWQIFEALPMPSRQDEQWRRTDIGKLKLDRLTPYSEADAGTVESPLQLSGANAGLITHRNSVTVDRSLDESTASQGVVFIDLDTAV